MDKSLCAKATADSDQPTPGYMYNEIGRITHASVDACRQLEEYLVKRLAHSSVHVKLKALRVMKHCCQHGHLTFRRDMQGKTAVIKESMQYRGPPDALHGDQFNRQVREVAQEVMNAIFDTTTASEQLLSTGRMQGFGSDGGAMAFGSDGSRTAGSSYMGGIGAISGLVSTLGGAAAAAGVVQAAEPRLESGAYSTGRMQGFGNPNFETASTNDASGAVRLAAMATGIGETVMARLGAKFPGGGGVQGGRGLDEPYSAGSYAMPQPGGAAYRGAGANGVGGGCGAQPGPWGAPPAAPPPPVPMSAPARAAASVARPLADTFSSLEEKLVAEATEPGGMRATLPRDELRRLSAAVRTLDARAVCTHLQARLGAPEWQRRLKALCVLEALLKDDHADVLAHFRANAHALLALRSCAQMSVVQRAESVVALLGVAAGSDGGGAEPAGGAGLLGGDEAEPTSVNAAAATPGVKRTAVKRGGKAKANAAQRGVQHDERRNDVTGGEAAQRDRRGCVRGRAPLARLTRPAPCLPLRPARRSRRFPRR